MVGMLPESDIGIVLLSNSDSADSQINQMWYRDIMAMYLFDVATQTTTPTFETVQDACNFPCNILPTLCSDQVELVETKKEVVKKKEEEEEVQQIETTSSSTSSTSSSSCVNLTDYIGTYFQPAYGNVVIQFTDTSESELLMSIGNFIDFPTNATLTFQTNGGSDRFIWNIGNTQAQTLYHSQVYFIRNFTDGSIQALYLDTMDSSSAHYRLWFTRVTGDGEEDHDHHQRVSTHATMLNNNHRTTITRPTPTHTLLDNTPNAIQHVGDLNPSFSLSLSTLLLTIVLPLMVTMILVGFVLYRQIRTILIGNTQQHAEWKKPILSEA